MDNNDFFGENAVVVGNDEEVDAFGVPFHGVVVGSVACADVGFESIDLVARHVEHLDGSAAFHVLKVDVHLSAVGVGHNVDLGWGEAVLVNIEERRLEVEGVRDAVAVVLDSGSKYHKVRVAVGHVNLALAIGLAVEYLGHGAVFDGPRRFADAPYALVPNALAVDGLPDVESVLEREELRVGDYGNGVAIYNRVSVLRTDAIGLR